MGSPFCIVDVDDFDAWVNLASRQMGSPEERLIFNGYEFGGHGWFYRGQSNAAWNIASSFERCVSPVYNDLRNPERDLKGREVGSIAEFKAKAWRYVSNKEMDNLEWLMLMRHHGVPTRLVDFTESASVALYFALVGNPKEEFAVWAVNRMAFHDQYLQSLIGKEVPGAREAIEKYGQRLGKELNDLSNVDSCLVLMRKAQAEMTCCEATAMLNNAHNRMLAKEIIDRPLNVTTTLTPRCSAVYFYPEYPSARMLAQRGLFMMSESLSTSFMASLFGGLSIDGSCKPDQIKMSEVMSRGLGDAKLVKYVFGVDDVGNAERFLRFANCTVDAMYPDIEGVARSVELKVRKALESCENIGYISSAGTVIDKNAAARLAQTYEQRR